MPNDLVEPDDLDHLSGAPFTDAEVDAAVAAVRRAAGWHIAPERTETVALDVMHCDSWLRLPTGKLVAVETVTDADTDTVISPDRYRVSHARAQIRRRGCWPSGYERVEVEMTHGYDAVPLELLAVIGEAVTTARRDQTVTQQTAGPYSVSLGNGGAGFTSNPIGTGAILEEFTLRYMPGIA